MNEREYQRLKKQIADDCRRKMDALEVVWAFASTTSDVSAKTRSPKDAEGGEVSGERRGVLSFVEAVMVGLPEIFTTKDVEAQFARDSAPERSSISHALKRMTKDGRLEIAEAGKGQRATKYRRLVSVPSAAPHKEVRAEMATEADRQEIAHMLKQIGVSVDDFREEFLSEYGVSRVIELTKDQVDAIKNGLQKKSIGGGPIKTARQIDGPW